MISKEPHYKCISIIENIEHLLILKRHYTDGLNSYAKNFETIKVRYERKLRTIDAYISRLTRHYNETLTKLK